MQTHCPLGLSGCWPFWLCSLTGLLLSPLTQTLSPRLNFLAVCSTCFLTRPLSATDGYLLRKGRSTGAFERKSPPNALASFGQVTRTAWEPPGGKPEVGGICMSTELFSTQMMGNIHSHLEERGSERNSYGGQQPQKQERGFFLFKGRERVNKKGHFGKPSP